MRFKAKRGRYAARDSCRIFLVDSAATGDIKVMSQDGGQNGCTEVAESLFFRFFFFFEA
jgi:hypothetical protein